MAEHYTVQLIERWTFLNPQRNPTDGYRITFRVEQTGMVDHIVVSETEFKDKEGVAQKIQQKVLENLEVFTL